MTLSDAEARDRFLVHEAHRAISEEAADGFYDDVAVFDLEILRGEAIRWPIAGSSW